MNVNVKQPVRRDVPASASRLPQAQTSSGSISITLLENLETSFVSFDLSLSLSGSVELLSSSCWSFKPALQHNLWTLVQCPDQFPEPLPSGSCPSCSSCLVPMSCETGSRPVCGFNNAFIWMTFPVLKQDTSTLRRIMS